MAASSDLSSWRNFRKPRVATRPVGRPRNHPKIDMFYGYPAELIAEWCSADRPTAMIRCLATTIGFQFLADRNPIRRESALISRQRPALKSI